MDCLLNFTLHEIQEKLTARGLEKYRALQVFTALQQGKTFDETTTLNNQIKELLNASFTAQPLTIHKTFTSKDGTIKYLFKLADNNLIEGVLMKYKFGNTLCVSTQVGCAMGCTFCASGLDGLNRNLTTAEILGQVVAVNKLLGGDLGENRKITNIVLMGSGEPLANYQNVTKFFDIVTHKNGLMMSERNITLSTCGIANKIIQLADDGYTVNLSISLHAHNE